jgi:dihydroorotase
LREDTIEAVPEVVAGGVIGFKLYMGNAFGRIASASTGAMLEALGAVAPTGKRISRHAETNSIMQRRETRLRAAGRTDALAHLDSRPAMVAIEAAIQLVGARLRRDGAALATWHVGSPWTL